jgi:ATP-binding cassette subfamily G (WHITE) protein 2 (SNQ2)
VASLWPDASLTVSFNALTSFSELPSQMQGRASSLKQATNYLMFRPGALALAQTIADFPFNAVNILIFVIILYFMAGLVYTAGAFFITYLFILLGFQVMSAFFRVLGTSTTSYDVAARLASVLISAMVTYAGYMIPVFTMKRWLFWIYYLNPLSYAYEAIFANEFSRIELQCDSSYTIPHNVGSITKYPNNVGPNQLCSLPGSGVGQNSVSGTAYMAAGFEFAKSHIWRNFGILLGFFIAFLIMQVLSMEYLQKGANALAVVVFKKEDKDTKERNERLQERKVAFKAGKLEADLSEMATSSKPFTWENLNYTVPVPGGERQLLNNVFGYVKPGSLTALMGASGAGKVSHECEYLVLISRPLSSMFSLVAKTSVLSPVMF